ncbi:MAG: aldo/keto reductase, partial [Ktedonobacterales bacterium]
REVRQALQTIAQGRGKTLTNLAIAWMLRQPAVTGAIIGIRSERGAREMVRFPDWQLTEQESAAVERALAPWD